MIDPATIPANLRRAIDRRPVFAPYVPPAKPVAPVEAPSPDDDIEPENAFVGLEKLLHRDFITDMNRREVHLVHARTDMVSTIERGTPDFHCMHTGTDGTTRGAAVEFKTKGKKPSPKQRECIREMRRKRIPVLVAWTLADAINFVRKTLMLP